MVISSRLVAEKYKKPNLEKKTFYELKFLDKSRIDE